MTMSYIKRLTNVVALSAFLLMLSPIVFAHGGPGHGGAGNGNVYFDENTITTFTGTITQGFNDWQEWGHGNHTGGGMGYEFKADSGESFDLMLAPFWFLQDNGISLNNGDRITVTGSVVDQYISGGGGHHMGGNAGTGDNDYIIVTVLQVGGTSLTLRDNRGYPVWSGNGGGSGGGSTWFDPDTIQTLNGTFKDNLGLWSCWGYGNYTGNGMHMTFDSDGGTSYYAMLGPWWYLEENGIVISENSTATITGSVVDSYWSGYNDLKYLIATEITVDGKTVKLRDNDGIPLWSGTGWHYYSPAYEKKTAETVAGTVTKVRTRSNGSESDPGLEVILKNADGRYRVFIAPAWHAQNISMTFKKGQEIRVKGSVLNGKENRFDLVAARIIADGKTFKLRKNDGTPNWVVGAK